MKNTRSPFLRPLACLLALVVLLSPSLSLSAVAEGAPGDGAVTLPFFGEEGAPAPMPDREAGGAGLAYLACAAPLAALPDVGGAARGHLSPCAVRGPFSSLRLLPGGMPFGIRMQTRGVMIVGVGEVKSGGKVCRPAYDGGLRVRDVLLAIDGKEVTGAEDVTARIGASAGNPLRLTVLRGEARMDLTVRPVRSDKDGRYQCGLMIRDTASGIGTVTFIDPENGIFGGLGHAVCDGDCGAILPLSHGTVLSVRVNGVVRGEAGKPGELRGSFSGRRLGSLTENTECGVFGVIHTVPEHARQPMPVAAASEVREGEATVLCTLGDDGVQEYRVRISAIDRSARPTKSFTVTVTDPALLERTGGIVQGMSGSPILQDGKLIGAVTHVLVDDPTTGYGIFLENMLTRMQLRVAA